MHVSSSSKFWDEKNEAFYKKYHGIAKQHERWKDIVVSGRPLEGPMGRSWSIPLRKTYSTKYGFVEEEIKIPWTTLSNYPVQGTGADVMMLARIMAYKRIKKEEIPCVWRSTVHDSLVLDTHKKHLEQLRDLFDGVFADLPKTIKQTFGYDWIVPMACETKFGSNMKTMEKFK
jgi:DNA polymerase I-like protein with 3'-5' exonuclease and polymerase domains